MTAKATRRSPKGERSRSAILDAASEEFAARGYRGASLVSIAERAGITQSGLLHHYPTKEHLLDAVLATRFTEDASLLDEASSSAQAVPLAGYPELAERNAGNPTWVRLLTILSAEGLTDDHPSYEAVRDRYERVRARMRGRLETQAARGLIPGDLDLDVLSTLVLAAMDGVQLQWLYHPEIDMPAAMEMLSGLVAAAAHADLTAAAG